MTAAHNMQPKEGPKYDALRRLRPDIEGFRSIQEPAIDALLAGERLLCLMPTGAGKSLIYQVAGLALGTCTLIVSPLVALMRQQSEELCRLGMRSLNLSGLDWRKQQQALQKVAQDGLPRFLFASPERIAYDGLFEEVLRTHHREIGLVVVDEAHCVSQWGEDFRPAYRTIPDALENVFGDAWPALLCLSATLNTQQQREIQADFRITETLKAPTLWRDNLTLHIENLTEGGQTKDDALMRILDAHQGEKVLVFCHRKRGSSGTTRTLDEQYRDRYEGVGHFDADMADTEKEDVLRGLTDGTYRIVFATSAFGMGLDIPDIRVVVDYLIPETVEQYYQEVGRAGRDGRPAEGHLLYTRQSRRSRLALLKATLCTEATLRQTWEEYAPTGGPARARCVNLQVMTEAQRTAFSLLVDYGVFHVIAKGVQSLDCFQGVTAEGKAFLKELKSHSKRSASMLIIARRSGADLATLARELWQRCAAGSIRMVSAPAKGIFFDVGHPLDDDTLAKILADQEAKRAERTWRFRTFCDAIEAGSPQDNESGATAERLIRHELGM